MPRWQHLKMHRSHGLCGRQWTRRGARTRERVWRCLDHALCGGKLRPLRAAALLLLLDKTLHACTRQHQLKSLSSRSMACCIQPARRTFMWALHASWMPEAALTRPPFSPGARESSINCMANIHPTLLLQGAEAKPGHAHESLDLCMRGEPQTHPPSLCHERYAWPGHQLVGQGTRPRPSSRRTPAGHWQETHNRCARADTSAEGRSGMFPGAEGEGACDKNLPGRDDLRPD